MSIFLSKLLPLLVYPLGLGCLLILVGLLLKRKSQQWGTSCLGIALLVLWLGGNHWVAFALARSLEWQNMPSPSMPQAEVMVVLGGGTEPALYPRPAVEISAAGDRVLYAARLYKQGAAPHILLSGGNINWLSDSSASSPASEMADILTLVGIPQNAMWLETQSLNTYENAVYSKTILQPKGISRIILVTSALHMPRAKALFEHEGFNVIPAPTDFTVTQAGWDKMTEFNIPNQIINLLPNNSSLSLTTNVLKEYIGMFVYGFRDWL